MLLTVDTTEAVEAIAEAQENLQEVAKNPGILRTSFQLCWRSADPFAETFCGGRLYH